MRCQAGDIAIIVKPSDSVNLFALVQIERDAAPVNGKWTVRALQSIFVRDMDNGGAVLRRPAGTPGWASDCNLRPLRDTPGPDEMLRLVGRPVGVADEVGRPV